MHDISRLDFHSLNAERSYTFGNIGTPTLWYDFSRTNTTEMSQGAGTVSVTRYINIINYGTTTGNYNVNQTTLYATYSQGGSYVTNSKGTYSAWFVDDNGGNGVGNYCSTSPATYIDRAIGTLFVVFKSPSNTPTVPENAMMGIYINGDATRGNGFNITGDSSQLTLRMMVGSLSNTITGVNITPSTWYIASMSGNTISKLNNITMSATTSSGGLLVGGNTIIINGAQPHGGSVAEIMYYNFNIDNEQHGEVYNYLSTKYSI